MGAHEGRSIVTQQFLAGVRSIVEPLLSRLGFDLLEYDDSVGRGDAAASVVYFQSDDCKIQVYDSPRSGSINCMIATLDASNTFGPSDEKGEWQYLPRFAVLAGVPLDQIESDGLPEFPTLSQWLESICRRIERYYPVAHEGVLKMAGPE